MQSQESNYSAENDSVGNEDSNISFPEGSQHAAPSTQSQDSSEADPGLRLGV